MDDTAQTPNTRLIAPLSEGSTYRRILYVLAGVPVGVVYWLLLLLAASVDVGELLLHFGGLLGRGVRGVLRSLGRAVRRVRRRQGYTIERPFGRRLASDAPPHSADARRFAVAHAAWIRLAAWERRQTMRWIGVEPASFAQPPLATLAFLLLRLPFCSVVAVPAFLAVAWAVLLLGFAVRTFVFGTEPSLTEPRRLLSAFGALLGVALALGAPLALNALALLWGRLALVVFSGEATLRKLRDAEARTMAEQARAEQAERSRRDLMINVGHELRTPTAVILGHVESLLLALHDGAARPSDATLRRNLQVVYDEADRMSALLDELLALARNETDQVTLDIRPTAADQVVEEVYRTLAPLAQRKQRITLVREVAPHLPLVAADRQRLLQVLHNLVRNAIAYTPGGGIVSIVVTRADDDGVVLAVRDTGIGIPPAELERVFDRFHRGDPSRTRAAGGFGLGLAIVRELVEAMDGTVTAHSAEGVGSSFEIRLPIAPAAGSAGCSPATAKGG